MTPFRMLQVATAAVIMVAHVWIVQATVTSPRTGDPMGSRIGVASASAPAADNGDNSDNGSEDNSDNGSSDDNGNSNSNGNGNSNRNSNANRNSNENRNDLDADNYDPNEPSTILPPRPSSAAPAAPFCSTPGQEVVFASTNQRITVRVFPAMPTSVRVEMRPVFDLLAVPNPPGQLVGLLVYDIVAGACSDGGEVAPIRVLPAEVNLNVLYTDIEALGLDESRFVIAHLDFQTVAWTPVEMQSLNAAGNAIGATITETGYYAVYQRP